MSSQDVSALLEYVRQIADHTGPDRIALGVNIALALGTFLTFLATAIMAWKTAALASDTADASVLADIHHQEQQSGLVVWMGERRIDFSPGQIVISGYLANIGGGAATTVMFAIQGPNDDTDVHLGVFAPTLGAGQEFPLMEIGLDGKPFRTSILWAFEMGADANRDLLYDIWARAPHLVSRWGTNGSPEWLESGVYSRIYRT